MLYTACNAPGAIVTDVEARRRLDHVIGVDTTSGEVVRARYPFRTKPGTDDQVDTYVERFRAIHPISGLERYPVLFHCYGRLTCPSL